jgi:hypothetical protein
MIVICIQDFLGGSYTSSLAWGYSALDFKPMACCDARGDHYRWWHHQR